MSRYWLHSKRQQTSIRISIRCGCESALPCLIVSECITLSAQVSGGGTALLLLLLMRFSGFLYTFQRRRSRRKRKRKKNGTINSNEGTERSGFLALHPTSTAEESCTFQIFFPLLLLLLWLLLFDGRVTTYSCVACVPKRTCQAAGHPQLFKTFRLNIKWSSFYFSFFFFKKKTPAVPIRFL